MNDAFRDTVFPGEPIRPGRYAIIAPNADAIVVVEVDGDPLTLKPTAGWPAGLSADDVARGVLVGPYPLAAQFDVATLKDADDAMVGYAVKVAARLEADQPGAVAWSRPTPPASR